MKVISSIFLLFIGFFLTALCWPEQDARINVHDILVDNGSNSDFVNAVIRDKEGFLWLGTDNGAKRYDGYNISHFKNDQHNPTSIGTDNVNTLLLDKQNVLWLAGKTLNRFNPFTETFDSYEVSSGVDVRALLEDSNDILWIGGEGFGLTEFNRKEGKTVGHYLIDSIDGLNPSFINAVAHDIHNPEILWVASSAGVLLFNKKTHHAEVYPTPIKVGSGVDSIRDIMVAKSGLIWASSAEGVFVLNPKSGSVRQYVFDENNTHSLSSNATWRIFQDSKGGIWVGTDKKGVNKYRPNTDDFLRLESSSFDKKAFPVATINSIEEDNRGSLWFSVATFGVRRVTENLDKFKVLKNNPEIKNSLAFNIVYDVLEDAKGNIWIATDGGGLDHYDPKRQIFTHYKHRHNDDDSLSSDSVISLTEGPDGDIWAGTWAGGLNRLNLSTGKFTHIRYEASRPKDKRLGNNNIFRLEFDHEGWLWVSVWRKGLQRYNPKTGEFQSYFSGGIGSESGISNLSINDFVFSKNNRGVPIVWVGGHSGFERFNTESGKFTRIALGGVESIYDIFMESENILWLATSSGLIKYFVDTERTVAFERKNGLADNLVTSIEKDRFGDLWLGTRSGLNRFNPSNESFTTFTHLDGLAGSRFTRYSHLMTNSGDMYFGGTQGLTVFNPTNMPINTLKPNVIITDIELFQKVVKPGEVDFLPRHISYMNEITITYEQRDIAFRFSALDFISPGKNLYRYRLLGFEEEWNNVGSHDRRARYANLAPGKYTFQVLGSNNNGIWNEKGASIKVVILPPWWLTWWAIVCAIIIFIASVYSIIFWRLRSAGQRKHELEMLVKKKTKEIEAGNRSIRLLNSDLENRVTRRTEELSLEVEERRSVEAKLFHMAFHDALTGLPNRPWLIRRLESIVQKVQDKNHFNFGLMFLDGDSFKNINDTHGHMLGDELLVAVAERLAALMPKKHYVSRLGGDEFTILIDRRSDEESLVKLAKSIVSDFNIPFVINNNRVVFKVSIGIVLCDNNYKTPEQILRDADISMYRAKTKGKGTYQLFDQYMRDQTVGLIALENDLQWALEREEFELVYQPIVSLKQGELQGFEVLLRWNNPEKGYIPPDVFIPVAEESGLILPIGLWVLRTACKQLSVWLSENDLAITPTIAVNISALQLAQPDLIEHIDGILFESKINSRLLKLEITESALMKNTDNINKILDALRFRGIELAIDDFGTGYSSLSYLDQLPVQVLKIDRSFIDSMMVENSSGASEIVRATISLAHNLKLQVVAEGIETQAQFDRLKEYGCDFGQGYLMSKPLSRDNATAYLLDKPIDVEADKYIATSVSEHYQESKQYRKFRDEQE